MSTLVPARGGAPVRLTDHPADDLVPSWSRDGKSIYFGSTRTGPRQIWRMSARGGDAVQVTQRGGTYAKESVDRKYLYYGRTGAFTTGLWRVPVPGGEEVEVVPNLASYGNFAVASDGLYFEARLPGNPLGHTPDFTPFTRPGGGDRLSQLCYRKGQLASSRWIDMPGMASPCRQTSARCSSHRWMPSPKI